MAEPSTSPASIALDVAITGKVFLGRDGAPVRAIENISFRAEDRSVTALIGPSGCGKTTTLRIIAGLELDFDGHIAIAGNASVGFVFQEPRLLPWKTLDQNVRLPLTGAAAKADFSDLYTDLGLTGLENRYPAELSLGLARRASIARALAIRPDVLILDEPSASLDETTAARMRQVITTLIDQRKVTTLLVTHNIREALGLADRLVLLAPRPGRVIGEVAISLPREVRTHAFIEDLRTDLIGRFPQTVA